LFNQEESIFQVDNNTPTKQTRVGSKHDLPFNFEITFVALGSLGHDELF
jgi:hypothetical protein